MSQVVQPGAAPVTGPQLDNRRVLAALIDLALMVPVVLVLVALFGGFTPAVSALSGGWALYYYFAMESGDGQTIGKRVMKIRVARADGGPLDMGRVAVRTLLRPIDGLFIYLLGLIVMLATGGRRQRLGDLAAGTVVTEADAPAPAPVAEAVALPPVFEGVAAPPEPAPEGDTLLPPAPHLPNPSAHSAPEPEAGPEPEPEPEPELEASAEAPAEEPPPGPVDIGRPLPAVAPSSVSVPELRSFDPFSQPAAEAEAEEPESAPEAVEPEAVEPEPLVASEPAEGLEDDGVAQLVQAVKEAEAQRSEAAVEPEPTVEAEPEPVEPEVPAEPVENEAEQAPEADEPQVDEPAEERPKLEIISSAIDLVMAEDEPSEPADESSDEPADEEPGPQPA